MTRSLPIPFTWQHIFVMLSSSNHALRQCPGFSWVNIKEIGCVDYIVTFFCYVFQYFLHEDLHKFIFAFTALKSVPLLINLFLLLEERRLRNHHVSQFGLSLKKLRAKSDSLLSPGQGLLMTQFASFYAPIIPYPLTKLTQIHYGHRLNYLHFV